jgi:hypothetical protein
LSSFHHVVIRIPNEKGITKPSIETAGFCAVSMRSVMIILIPSDLTPAPRGEGTSGVKGFDTSRLAAEQFIWNSYKKSVIQSGRVRLQLCKNRVFAVITL